MNWLQELQTDIGAFAISFTLVIGYYYFLRLKTRNNPTYTIHGVNALARKLWVENVMRDKSQSVMGVQTMRNFVMGAQLMASTAALLIVGTLTLSGQAENISHSWHALSIIGSHSTALWIIKVMMMLVDFIVAFFAFAMCVRLANHVVFMINVPDHDAHHSLSPAAVGRRLHRAGNMFAIGMRAFFFSIPLVFWLFGPDFLILSTIGLIIALYHLDRSEQEGVHEIAPSPSVSKTGSVISMQTKNK